MFHVGVSLRLFLWDILISLITIFIYVSPDIDFICHCLSLIKIFHPLEGDFLQWSLPWIERVNLWSQPLFLSSMISLIISLFALKIISETFRGF